MDHNEGSFPLLNTVNAPVEQCEFLKNRFLQFLNDYICTDEAAPIGPNGAYGAGGICVGKRTQEDTKLRTRRQKAQKSEIPRFSVQLAIQATSSPTVFLIA